MIFLKRVHFKSWLAMTFCHIFIANISWPFETNLLKRFDKVTNMKVFFVIVCAVLGAV